VLQATTGNLSAGAAVDRATNYAGRSNWAADDPFRGQLNQLRIWNYARTATQIQDNRDGIPAAVTADANLLGYWLRSELDASGKVNDLSTKDRDAWLVQSEDWVRLEQYASIHLRHGGTYATDAGWADIYGFATDGRKFYHYYNDNRIVVFSMDGALERTLTVSSATLGTNQTGMAYSSGWLFIRNPGASDGFASNNTLSNPVDDKIYRVSPVDGSTTEVTLDASYPLLGTRGWQTGHLMGLPDGRLGIFSGNYATGAATVRLYTLADNGTRLVWSEDRTLNIGANWLNDFHGATTDGTYLYVLRMENGTNHDYRVFDLRTGTMVFDGSNTNLYQQSVDNATHLAIDPLTGDIYFADFAGSHIARASRINGATREAVVEYGANGATLPPPLLTTQASAPRPDIFVTDTRDVQVRVGNTAPAVSNWSATLAEDGTLSFTGKQFTDRFTDPESDALATITLSSIPAAGEGVLKLDGTTLANGATIALGDLGKLVFVPVANFNGSTSFSYSASDGNLSSSSTATVAITVTAVNDAPVLNASATPTFDAINEDDVDNLGTLVSALVADGSITDPDVGTAPEAIAVTRVDNTHGVWQYKVGSGDWTPFSTISGALVDLKDADGLDAALLLGPNDRIRFVPNANVNSSANGSPSISFRAWDQSTGTAGGTTNPNLLGGNTAVSSASDSASLTISAVNDLPTTANKTVTMDEDTTRVFSAADFSFNDIDGDSLASVTLQPPSAGELLMNGVVQSAALTVSAANLSTVAFRPAAEAYGTAYATLAFTVNDGTADSASATLTFNVTDTNDAPTAMAWASGGTVAENSAQGTVVGKLSATDPNSGDTFTFVRVSNPNFNVSPDGTVTVAANATIDFERTTTQTLRVQVKDSQGLSYEQDLTVTLSDVAEAAPSLIVNAVYVTKGGTVTITESQLKAVDKNIAADGTVTNTPNSGLVYTVTSAPSGGTWWIDTDNSGTINGNEVALAPVNEGNPNGIDTFTHDDVATGKLKFTQDGTQANSLLQVSLSDGTPSSLDADGNAAVTGSLVAIVSSPPVLAAAINNQEWGTTGSQSFVLPSNTFTDPDFDVLTLSAQLANGSALPSWLTFNASTGTFSGNPADGSMANGSSLSIRVTASDGRTTPVSDDFELSFSAAPTLPQVLNPIPDVTFNGSGVLSYTVPETTFKDPNNDAFTYAATIPSELTGWLSFNTSTRVFSGNPPAGAGTGPHLITVTATANGDSVSNTFRLFITNANDAPIEASPVNVAIPNRTITDANEHFWTIPINAFSDADGDSLTLRAGDIDGNPLPSWVRFDPATRTFSAKAPSGSGVLTVYLFADDGQGASGSADFTITYSGGSNMAPQVKTPDGIYSTDGRGDLNLASEIKAEKFSLAQGATATITKDHLQELDPDDDGADVTYTVTTAPRYGQIWLDTDGDGTINGAETTLRAGSTFTQADIDGGKLKYRNTDTATAQGDNPPDDSFIFGLADGGEDNAAPVNGAVFKIEVTPKPVSPTLLSVLRSTATTQVEVAGTPGTYEYVTNSDTVTFKLIFSENVRDVDASDFVLTGSLAAQAQIIGVTAINASTWTVTVGSNGTPGIANADGTLGLALAGSGVDPIGIQNSARTSSLSTAQRTGLVDNEAYTLDNTGPTVSSALTSARVWHDGTSSTAFYITIDFDEPINDLTLNDFTVTNATLSNLQRVSTNYSVDPDQQALDYDPANPPEVEGNRYRVLVTPTANSPITVRLNSGAVTDAAGNGNTAESNTLTIAGQHADRREQQHRLAGTD